MSQRRHAAGSLHRPPISVDDDDNYSQTSQTSSHSSQSDTDLQDQSLLAAAAAAAADPFQAAISELESLVIAHLNSFKEHPGIKTNPNSTDSVHKELELLLRPILEIAAHTGPAQARAHYWKSSAASAASLSGPNDAGGPLSGVDGSGNIPGVNVGSNNSRTIDAAIEEVHNVLNLELIFPVLLETAQSDSSPNKRAAALSFFHNLFLEYKLPGSYLDYVENPLLIRYSGTLYGSFEKQKHAPPSRMVLKQRTVSKANRCQKLLRYWIEASSFCILPGAFTSIEKDDKIASRAVISSSAVIRPALNHVKDKIKSADDAGALRLFLPVMKMIAGVLQRLFLVAMNMNHSSDGNKSSSAGGGGDALKSACIKFLEIVVLCFSSRAQPAESHKKVIRSNVANKEEDFALEDLPVGHPIITRQALEEIGEDAFTVLRGLAMMGGQVKVDSGVKSDVRMSLGLDSYGQGATPTLQIVGILRPAALSYLELESTMNQKVSEEKPFPALDRSDVEMDFQLNQKSYALTINAISMLATNRPTFFADSSSCLARRAMDPPTIENSLHLSKAAIMTVNSHLRASCLTLLRNSLSVTTGASDILFKALASEECGMKIQAEKALRMATQAASLKTAGRAARNRAAVFYEWEGTALAEMETFGSKRKRAGEDKLEQMRAAKAARGLGNGIQLPKNMVDACELIFLNLGNLPPSRAAITVGDKKKSKVQSDGKRKRLFTLDYLIDAIMTNGESLISNENKWYGRDGGDAWVMDISALVSEDEAEESDDIMTVKTENKKKVPVPVSFTLDTKIMDAALATTEGNSGDDVELYKEQCKVAAADAVERILSRSRSVRDPFVADFGNQIAAKMAWSLRKLKPHNELKTAVDMASEAVSSTAKKLELNNFETGTLEKLPSFFDEFPLVPSFIQFDINNASANNIDNLESERAQDKPALSLTQRLLNEAILASGDDKDVESNNLEKFEHALHLYITSVLHACELADEKPLDTQRKKLASAVSSSLSKDLSMIPVVTEHSLELLSLLCDVDGITKKATEISRKTTNQNLATAAATHGKYCTITSLQIIVTRFILIFILHVKLHNSCEGISRETSKSSFTCTPRCGISAIKSFCSEICR